MMILGWPFFFMARSYLCPVTKFWKKLFSHNMLKTDGWTLQCMIKVVKDFSYNQNVVPWVDICLYPWAVYKHKILHDPRITFDLFYGTVKFLSYLNCCPTCCGNTGRILHGICRYVMSFSIRWANRGPWASCLHLRGLESLCIFSVIFERETTFITAVCFLNPSWAGSFLQD